MPVPPVSLRARPLAGFLAFALLLPLGLLSAPTARAAIAAGGVATVVTTEGDRLALRDGPGAGYAALTTLAEGQQVAVLGGPVVDPDGAPWYQVTALGLTGWCAGEWLASLDGVLRIGGTDGDGARLRDGPGLAAAILLVLPEGAAVVPTGAPRRADGLDWSPVEYGGDPGWVASRFLGAGDAGDGTATTDLGSAAAAGAPAAAPAVAAVPGLVAGDRAAVVDTDGLDLRIRDGVGLDAPIFAYAPAGAVLLVVNGPRPDADGADWYGVDYDGVQGWVLGEHLSRTDAALSRRSRMAAAGTARPAPADPARGRAVAAEALRHLGAPYAWGGTTPAGWDCSGMIVYVYARAAGLALPRTTEQQYAVGSAVALDDLLPGDLVFFADTAGPGISHNGIALGDGRFIHAQSEHAGTVITSLSDRFWASHYAGARRP